MINQQTHQCSSCEALMINGVYCHETGCPDAWRNRQVNCFECGCKFQPEERGQRVCPDCIAARDTCNECGRETFGGGLCMDCFGK